MLNYIGIIKPFKLPLWRRVEHFVWLSTDFIIFYCMNEGACKS